MFDLFLLDVLIWGCCGVVFGFLMREGVGWLGGGVDMGGLDGGSGGGGEDERRRAGVVFDNTMIFVAS